MKNFVSSVYFKTLLLAAMAVSLLACAEQDGEPKASSVKQDSAAQLQAEVFKSPTCGCCEGWVEHIQSAGINTSVLNQNDAELNATKIKFAIAPKHQSCHTAVINEYIFEGHIPAAAIRQFLNNPPEGALGLAVPGMPVGSPGMEMGGRYDQYQVLQLNADGSSQVFQTISSEQSAAMHQGESSL